MRCVLRPGEAERLAREGTRASIGDPAGTYARRIYNRLLIDLSHHSSRLEGNTYSLLDTERLVLGDGHHRGATQGMVGGAGSAC